MGANVTHPMQKKIGTQPTMRVSGRRGNQFNSVADSAPSASAEHFKGCRIEAKIERLQRRLTIRTPRRHYPLREDREEPSRLVVPDAAQPRKWLESGLSHSC